MNRYYVEIVNSLFSETSLYLYVFAYSAEQVRDMLKEYKILSVDITN